MRPVEAAVRRWPCEGVDHANRAGRGVADDRAIPEHDLALPPPAPRLLGRARGDARRARDPRAGARDRASFRPLRRRHGRSRSPPTSVGPAPPRLGCRARRARRSPRRCRSWVHTSQRAVGVALGFSRTPHSAPPSRHRHSARAQRAHAGCRDRRHGRVLLSVAPRDRRRLLPSADSLIAGLERRLPPPDFIGWAFSSRGMNSAVRAARFLLGPASVRTTVDPSSGPLRFTRSSGAAKKCCTSISGRSIASRSVSELTARDLCQWPSRADPHSRAASPPRGPVVQKLRQVPHLFQVSRFADTGPGAWPATRFARLGALVG